MPESRDTAEAVPHVTPFDGWVSLPRAAKIIGVTRQRVFQFRDEERLKTLRYFDGEEEYDPERQGSRPALWVIRTVEAENIKAAIEATRTCKECRALRAAGTATPLCVHVKLPAVEPAPA